MNSLPAKDLEAIKSFLLTQNSAEKVNLQQKARRLLLDDINESSDNDNLFSARIKSLRSNLTSASEIFVPDDVQKKIFYNDSGSHIIPGFIKNILFRIKASFVVRAGSINDVVAFVKWTRKYNISYTIRGAGTWPFGGAVPLDNDIILDLSYLDFKELYAEQATLVFGAGLLFPDARKYLQKNGFALKQGITNSFSGTLAGWMATGGLGLGSYKYGHIRESVLMLMVVRPDGELLTLTPEDESFNLFFGAEGQTGIIVGGALSLFKETYVSKPYAFAFDSKEDTHKYLSLLQDKNIKPTSVIYFDKNYIKETAVIEEKHARLRAEELLEKDDQKRLAEVQIDKTLIRDLSTFKHILVMHFDTNEDYQYALTTRLFGASDERLHLDGFNFKQLSTHLAHMLWEHRFLPVQMKQNGPSMLVSEAIIPFGSFINYQVMLNDMMLALLGIDVKTEAHLLQNQQILVQSIILADTRTFRHKLYFGLVPLMTQLALFFNATPYGIGIWNKLFFRQWRKSHKDIYDGLRKHKKNYDVNGLINHSKFINFKGERIPFKVLTRFLNIFLNWFIKTKYKRQSGKHFSLSYPFERLSWNLSKFVFPKIVPSALKKPEKPLERLLAPCAECDSCERVCPTSDVFGVYGPATPITRRKTAERIAHGEYITKMEAVGFLACTRCDECVRVCPADVPLTDIFDMVEQDNRFQQALAMTKREMTNRIDRFWQIMKESPLYTEHSRTEIKDGHSHLQHGIRILYPRGFEYGKLFIDPETCIHCGMCSDENACMYGARSGRPRSIPELLDLNCALCNACVNYCPQNKKAQEDREVLNNYIYNATDLEEKKYWLDRQNRIHDTTTVNRSTKLTEMADRYVTEDVIMEIDKEASGGQIPVSGMGQGDRHMGIGFDAERFAHFHIVGPAQNRLHEGDPEEELSVILGKRDSYCRFDQDGNLILNSHSNIKLMTPVLYNVLRLESNGLAELALIKVAELQKSLVIIDLNRFFQNYNTFLREGGYKHLPDVVVPKVDAELIKQIQTNPRTNINLLNDLWRMPAFELEYHDDMSRTIDYILDSAKSGNANIPLIIGYLEVFEHDLIGPLSPGNELKDRISQFLDHNIDILHIHGRRNKEDYFVTSVAVRAIHHYLMRIGRRHEVSLIASGGIRLASDSQKTIQRGAEATLIDFAALLALDPSTYKAIKEDKVTTEKLLSLNVERAVERLQNQAESRKVQILEVLGASGFKDIKKTVGEEGRLIDFHQLENRLQKTVLENEIWLSQYEQINNALIKNEPIPEKYIRSYSYLKKEIIPLNIPHNFYLLGNTNQTLYKRDYVWPGTLIENLGRMSAGDLAMLDFRNNKQTGLLGDGFDVMKILYNKDPMDIPDEELDEVITAMPLDKDLVLEAPWMFGGKSVGSIGLDIWRAHVIAAKKLGIQYDTGEGGYPTSIFLNSKGEPVFFTEEIIEKIAPFFENGKEYTIDQIRTTLLENDITEKSDPEIYDKIKLYPSLKPIKFMVVVGPEDEPFVSTELKTGLFGVSKQTIQKARRIVIAYSQGAKMGIGGHILSKKVNKLVSYLRGVDGVEKIQADQIERLSDRLRRVSKKINIFAEDSYQKYLQILEKTLSTNAISNELKNVLYQIQDQVYRLYKAKKLDEIDFENLINASEAVIEYSYSSIISPFPFHNCYSIEDVKAFIDIVHMINPGAVISVKVSPSIDIEFIAAGLARIAKDNTEEMVKKRFGKNAGKIPEKEINAYRKKYGMKIEMWLDGPRGGTGASPNIIKGQMGMHIEYAVPLIHNRLVKDNLRNHLKFIVAGGIRTYEDVIKSVALGADGVIWGTACLVSVGCDRNRNCHDGCSRGIATSNLDLQKLRNVENNTQQMINAFLMMQMQVIRALSALGFKDIRELRGRFDKLHWVGLKERVDHRFRMDKEIQKAILKDEELFVKRVERSTGQSNCGVAAINGTEPVPGYILDKALDAMRNRGMDGVGIAKTLCFPKHPDEYACSILVKGVYQKDIEENLRLQWQTAGTDFTEEELRKEARKVIIYMRGQIMEKIKQVFLDPFFDYYGETLVEKIRDSYKLQENREEYDYREFGDEQTDPGDIFRYFVRAKKDTVYEYVEKELLKYDWSHFLVHQFPDITKENYHENEAFIRKAEDLFVFNHTLKFTRILYASEINEMSKPESRVPGINVNDFISVDALNQMYQHLTDFPFERNRHLYKDRENKLAAVLSCGKNFGTWKSAGRTIPWETPDAPNNIIHVRLATGSVVEQMNSHPFAKLHTALTHNGETTNFEALKQRVEQFNLSPLASTDTEVAALKFHLIADEWAYPDWAVFESLSPTTGDDLEIMDPALRNQLENLQRVEFASSPDGPYQYLCLRHNPDKQVTERVDLKDPADLRPNVTAFYKDQKNGKTKVFSMIASEEHAINVMLKMLDKEGLIDGAKADLTQSGSGMISRYSYDEKSKVTGFNFVDRYGKEIELQSYGEHFSVRRAKLKKPQADYKDWAKDYKKFFTGELVKISFADLQWILNDLVESTNTDKSFEKTLQILTWLRDFGRTLDPGDKAISSIIDIADYFIEKILDHICDGKFKKYIYYDLDQENIFERRPLNNETLILNTTGFLAEGSDPDYVLAAFLSKAYDLGWRRFILYHVRGQRLISTAVMGNKSTDDVIMDVYGSPGEYFGAFMQGGTIRLHGNAQNFCAMCMHHGNLFIFGNAGKVCGYASKGGKVFIMGNVVDRIWTNSVNDARTQSLQVMILGSATKYAGESLMGGDFIFGGMHFNEKGQLSLNDRPCLGTKMLGGASQGTFVFFDPKDRLDPVQYVHGKVQIFDDAQWKQFESFFREMFALSNIPVYRKNGSEYINVDGKMVEFNRSVFKQIVPKGGLKGYESH